MKNKLTPESKILAKSSSGTGMLPMKQSKELEDKKTEQQKLIEVCNFIKNAFVGDGEVMCVESKKPIRSNVFFLVNDKNRGQFAVILKNL